MLETIILLIIGMYIGWNFQMPDFAKDFQTKIVAYFKTKL